MEASAASNLSAGERGKHTAGRDGAIMRLCDVPLLCKLQLPYLSNSAAPVVLRVPPALTVLATLVAADQVRGANLGRKRIMAVVWLARPRVNIQHVRSRSHMRACVAATPATQNAWTRGRSQAKPRPSGSVGIQVRRLRPMAKDRHGSAAAACGGTGDALLMSWRLQHVHGHGTEARSHGASPDAS